MDLDKYQTAAWQFALPSAQNFVYAEHGLVGEVGELFSLSAKAVRDGAPADFHIKYKKELGDVLWFVAALATMNGLSLSDVAGENLNKLDARRKTNTIQGSGDNRGEKTEVPLFTSEDRVV